MTDHKSTRPGVPGAQSDVQAPPAGLDRVQAAIARAKREKQRARKARQRKLVQISVSACIFALVLLPNTSRDIAEAMTALPVIGPVFEVVTFRDYHYEDGRHQADVHTPELIAGETGDDGFSAETAAEITQKIDTIAQHLMEEFEESLVQGSAGSSKLLVEYEILTRTEDYFTLKLMTFQGSGSGFLQNYYYTIDLNTGRELQLQQLFDDGVDYQTPVTANIQQQMRQQMAADEMLTYWIDIDEDDATYPWRFTEIAANQEFYVNADGELVIAFYEGEVAPMYMGAVEFAIPKDVTKPLGFE